MKTIKIEKLTNESFAPYGSFYDFEHPKGYALTGELHAFFPDRISETAGGRIGFSSIVVKKPDEMVIKEIEYHTTAPELILPLNDDMIIHVAAASAGKPITEETKAFLIPKGTMVKINTAVWHLAPLPVSEAELKALIILPECTYMNDITVVHLEESEQFIIK